MDFARKQLEKYGWKDGQGLGKNESGIVEALKPKLKFDNTGVGHDVGEQFTNNWWDRVFNTAARNIAVNIQDHEVKFEVSSSQSFEITTKTYLVTQLKKSKNLEYGSFLKTAKLTENGVENYAVSLPTPATPFKTLTDEELFAACGGRTAHKGARHGLKLSGKLSRIEKQEKILLKKMKNVSLNDDTEKKIKKLKKHKEENGPSPEPTNSTKKKNKKKRKSVSFNNETTVKYYTPEESSNENNNVVLLDPNSNVCDEGIEQDIEDNTDGVHNQESFQEVQDFSDLSKAERKKLKKKRKLEKKSKTDLFIKEVRQEMCHDSKNKKRKLTQDPVVSTIGMDSKKKKCTPERVQYIKEKKMMKSIVQSLDNLCKISDV